MVKINLSNSKVSALKTTNIIIIKLPHKGWCFGQALAQLAYPCQAALRGTSINILPWRNVRERKLKCSVESILVKSAYLISKWVKISCTHK